MKRRWSIAVRLALWLSIGMCLFWLGAAVISTTVLRSELERAFDENLRQSAFRLLPLAMRELSEGFGRRDPVPRLQFGPRGQNFVRRFFQPDEVTPAQESFTYLVYDREGNVLVRAEDAPASLREIPRQTGFLAVGGQRAYASTDQRTGLGILVVETSDHRGRALWDAVAGLFLPLAALLPIVALAIWLAVRAAMRPVERLSQDLALRHSGNLAPLADDDHPVELAPIAREIAALLERLRAALEAERAFAASSAHELRTPIAGALAQTQRLAVELGPHPSATRIKDVEQSLRNLSDLSEKLLQLSRLEAGFARADQPHDLLPVLELVVRDFQSRASTVQQVQLEIEPAADLTHRINPDAFAMAVRNLIQNALIHGASAGLVTVHAGPGTLVRVRNHGPVVAPQMLSHLRERFTRGPTRASGTGLGLAVVDAIMSQTGGRLVLRSPAPGWEDGFEASLELR